MTNERAREVAKKILDRAWGEGSPHYRVSEAVPTVLAYRDEVRRETLMEVRARPITYPTLDTLLLGAREQRRLFRVMLDEMIAETSPAETTAPINTGGDAVVIERPLSPRPNVPEVLTIHVQRGVHAFYVTCDQHRGLLTGEKSLGEALAAVVPALRDLLSVGPPHPDPHAFDGIDLGAPPSRDADLDTVLRTLAQAYVGNDYTIEGRKFQAAVERLWPR